MGRDLASYEVLKEWLAPPCFLELLELLEPQAEIVLAYPARNAEVEHGFSHANVIKTKSRNRLGASHLDQLLRLKLNSPDFEDSTYFEKAYHSWVTARKRRMIVEKPPPPSDHSDSDSD